MEFRILGPLEIEDQGRAIALGGPKQRALLAALLLTPNRPVSVDRLIDALWPTRPPADAANALQFHVSQLRKLLGDGGVIVTQEPGYLIRVDPDQVDLLRFERLVAEAERAEAARASRLLTEALDLWRGEPLSDLADDETSQAEIQRLGATRLAALELRIEADLALGRHAQLVPELEGLVRSHPLHERLSGALMQAAGRQADALEVYRTTRRTFVAELGIEPSPVLRELEQAILRHDPELAADHPRAAASRSIVVLVGDEHRLDDLLAIAEPLANRSQREVILARLTTDHRDLANATAALAAHRDALAMRGVACRVAAYTTSAAGAEAALLAAEQPVDLVLAEAPPELLGGSPLAEPLAELLEQAPCEVGLLTAGAGTAEGPIVTPFGGADHDWAAIDLAAWLAASLDASLRLLGTEADPALGRRDASRLLARASLLVQQLVGIVTEPVLVPPGDRGVVQAAAGARLLVIGLSDRWRAEGIGPIRLAIAAATDAPVLFVRRGLRSAGLAPAQTFTRFTWTHGSRQAEASSRRAASRSRPRVEPDDSGRI
jgi:DNA-binding SARP family transcriptional activator